MENFFYHDEFCHDLETLMHLLDIEDVEALPDDWTVEVKDTNLEKITHLTEECVIDMLVESISERNEDRFSEDSDDDIGKIKKAIKAGITLNMQVINELMPSLYFPNGKTFTITKEDIKKFT